MTTEGEKRFYLIWSEEHGAWWMPNKRGYTRSLLEAGRYTGQEAGNIVDHANRFLAMGGFNEIAILDPLK